MVNTLADAMNMLKNAEFAKKKEVTITPASKQLQRVLRIFQAQFKIALLGKINECKALMRLNYKVTQLELLERKLLPAPGLGLIILTTNQGIISSKEAEEKSIGGHSLCYVY